MYTLLQASQANTVWTTFNPDDTESDSSVQSLMNGGEPVDNQRKHKRDILLLVAATIAAAIAAAAGG